MLFFIVLTLCVISQCTAEGEEMNKCQPNPCQNNGRCRVSSWRDRGFYCRCEGHHWGSLCEKESKCKHENPCQNGGSCKSGGWKDEGYYCSCANGYYGDHCEKVSPCTTADPCQNGARCVSSSWKKDGYYCRCRRDYYGKNCSKKNPCLAGDLCNGGVCSMSRYAKDGYRCRCQEGKAGDQCQYDDPCKPENPCQNSGRCESYATSSGYTKYCQCPKTHWGDNCEKESPCKEETCQNGGKCYGGPTPDCYCPAGFRGRKCEKKKCPLTVRSCDEVLRGKGKGPGRGKGKGRPDPAQCMANVKQRYQRMEVCIQNTTAEITKLRNCDCLTQDIWHGSYSAAYASEFAGMGYCYLRSPEILKSLSCSSRTISCYKTVMKATRYSLSSNCSAENLASKRELKQCVEDYDAGQVTATGNCAPLEKVIKIVAPLIKLGEKFMCTSCDPRSFYECILRKHEGINHPIPMSYCAVIKENEVIKKCILGKMDANPSCSSFKADVATTIDFYLQELKKYQQKNCELLDSYAKTREETWGCPAEEL